MHPAHTTFDTEARAEQHLQNIHADIQRDRYACLVVKRQTERAAQEAAAAERRTLVPFGRYAARWLAERAESKPLKPRTVALYQSQLDAYLLPTFEDVPLPDITVELVDEWWADLCEQRPGRKTSNAQAYGLLKTIMGAAVRDRTQKAVTANPCQVDGVSKGKRRRIEPATYAEVQAIAEAMPDNLALAVHLAAWSGLRFGELAELRRRDVDLSDEVPMLRVTRGVVRIHGKSLVDTPKTDAGIRDVFLPPHLRKPLMDHLEQHAQPGPDGLLFTGPRKARGHSCGYSGCQGGHLFSATLYRAFTPARDAAGRPDLRWHDLRHTGATEAARNGATTAELQARMGHSTAAMAMHYQHATKERDRELAKRMSRTFKAAQKSTQKGHLRSVTGA